MCSKSIQHQNKYIVTNFIYQQPVRLYVAFASVLVFSCEIMISVLGIQSTAIRKNADYFKQFIQIFILFFASFKSFLN